MALFNGSRLRELRNNKKMSMAELAKLSEVSTSLISQIERDMVIPSVVTIWRLAKVLDTNINYFFDEEDPQDKVLIRKGNHKVVMTHGNHCHYKLLSSGDADRMLDMVEITLKKDSEYKQNPLVHDGEECGYVLKGELIVEVNGKQYTLNEGDSISFKSTLPHKYINHSNEDCVSIWSMTPSFF